MGRGPGRSVPGGAQKEAGVDCHFPSPREMTLSWASLPLRSRFVNCEGPSMSITFLITQLENLVIWGVRMHPGASLPWLGTELIKVPPLLSRKFPLCLCAHPNEPVRNCNSCLPAPGADGSNDRVKLLIEVS